MSHIRIKAVMLDMARCTEKHRYYHDLVPRLAAWGYNTIFAHFTDDEGCAMRFDSHPRLASPHAFTKRDMRRWVSSAAAHGVTVIPELESFGHTVYIHGLKAYRHLREPTVGHFNAINPLHRETRRIMRHLVRETAEVFDAPYIHMGLDEVNFGASPQVRRARRSKEKWHIFADYICAMRAETEAAGRRMMIWGDHLLKTPEIAGAVPKDIVICDWHYQVNVGPDTVEFFTERGFEVVCCPATSRSGDLLLPAALTQTNLQRFSRIAYAGGRRVIGLMNTVWYPQRMLCGIEQFALALGGAWFNQPETDPRDTLRAFVRRQYGLRRGAAVADAVLELSRLMPSRDTLFSLLDTGSQPAGPLTACELAGAEAMGAEARRLRTLFCRARTCIQQNHAEYENYALACAILEWAVAVGTARTNGAGKTTHRSLSRQGHALLSRCKADWQRGRYLDDGKWALRNQPARCRNALIASLELALERLA
ncbi:MAG: family 20 glycosylhydrolase [Kiritimatiellae bacterium]|nr:family 20 glycosylhydrolase [Kiritimatiellia bacterium]